MTIHIPFNKPYMAGRELQYIGQAHKNLHLSGDGCFTRKCNRWLEQTVGCKKASLTHSCTAALEMTALLANIISGDEIIMPSYTFVSTANAFVLRGATPVFVDIRPDTLNLDEGKIEEAITGKTKAIVVVHYAGIGCEMDKILEIARHYNLFVIEDNAQGLMSSYKGKPLGSIGAFSAVSFHETKNIISGEGGALMINADTYQDRAEIIRQKGTNRTRFLQGEVDKYTWTDIGSSYLPGELMASFLWAQMENAQTITAKRLALWQQYHRAFAELEKKEWVTRPGVPRACQHNAHMYYLLMPSLKVGNRFIKAMAEKGIGTVFHYVPLHQSDMGQSVGKHYGNLDNTVSCSTRLVRLPMWVGLQDHIDEVIDQTYQIMRSILQR